MALNAAATLPVAPVADRGGSAPVVAPPQALSFEDEDDDLPRPGKVWDNSGVDLATLLKNRGAEPAPAADEAFVNVEPVAAAAGPAALDVVAAWGRVLDSLKDQAGLYGLLSNARLAVVRDELAVVRIASGFAGLVKMLEAPARREVVAERLAGVLGRRVGVKFEVDDAAAAPAAESRPNPGAGAGAVPARRPERAAPPPPPAEAAGPPAIKITPELLDVMRKDPLVAAVMDKLGGTAVKIE